MPAMSLPEDLARLESLWRAGTLSDEEFQQAKAQVIGGGSAAGASTRPPEPEPRPEPAQVRYVNTEAEVRTWGLWLHLSMLSGFIVPGAGFLAPILIWQIKRSDIPELDAHGRRATNWLITSVIYLVLGIALSLLIIGIPLLIVLAICTVVFPIMAALKANNGEVWDYPGAIQFFPDPEHEPARY